MITFLEGVLVEKQPARAVLNVGGVGYEVFIPLGCYDRLPPVDTACRILVYDHLREESHQLFGFVSEDERRMFVQLLGISGVGPKVAMSVLSGLSVREIRRAVLDNDVKRLSSISGIGRKTAERMVVELKDKIGAADALDAVAGADADSGDTRLRDAVLALVALGHTQDTARKMATEAMKKAGGKEWTVEAIVRKALAG
jgi:Holliday junction DNA helicase RuvA